MAEKVIKEKLGSAGRGKRKYIYESRYQQIAVELAQKIAEGWYSVGEKLNARSTLASNYNVSPETARKAVNILVDLGIVTIRQGSGTYVASREKAHLFVERYQNTVSMQERTPDTIRTKKNRGRRKQKLRQKLYAKKEKRMLSSQLCHHSKKRLKRKTKKS